MMTYWGYARLVALAFALCLLPAAVVAQEEAPGMVHNVTVRPAPTGVTPRTADGHPDLTGVWNGMADNLLGVPNQMHNEGIAVENDHSTYDVLNGAEIATWPLPKPKQQNGEQNERAAKKDSRRSRMRRSTLGFSLPRATPTGVGAK